MGKQYVGHPPSAIPHVIDGIRQVGRVPVNDGGNCQIETRCAELLRVLPSVGDATLPEGADHLSQCVALLALVQARLAKLSEQGRLQPIQHEQGAFNAPQFLQRQIELILALVSRQPSQHGRWQYRAGLQGDTARFAR